MRNFLKEGLICIIFLVIISSSVYAIGISPPKIVVNFEPNFEDNYSLNVVNKDEKPILVTMYVEGELADYVTLLDKEKKMEPHSSQSFKFTLKLPNKFDKPGEHFANIVAKENLLEEDSGPFTLVATASVASKLLVRVPYPGKYVEADLKVTDVNKGENVVFILDVNNLGTEDLSEVSASIDVYDVNWKKFDTIETKKINIKSKEDYRFKELMNTSGYDSGEYYANATVFYDNDIVSDIEKFRIGSLYIHILNYTNKFDINVINKFSVWVRSNWNDKINDLSLQLDFFDKEDNKVGETYNGPEVSLNNFEVKELVGYWDTNELDAGKYFVSIRLYYMNNTTVERHEVFVKGKVNVVVYVAAVSGLLIFILLIYLIYRKLKR